VNVTCFDEGFVVSAWLAGSRNRLAIARQKMMATRALFMVDIAPIQKINHEETKKTKIAFVLPSCSSFLRG
jgi:hypothetical protein